MIKRLALCFAIGCSSLMAATGGVHDPQVEASLRQMMRSAGQCDREAGFYSMVQAGLGTDQYREFRVPDGVLAIARADAESRARLVTTLNALLDREFTVRHTGAANLGCDYYGDLIWAVGTLRDTSSIPVLLKVVSTGGAATGALAGLGDGALSGALDMLPTANDEDRHSLFEMFSEMAEPRNVSRLKAPGSVSKLLNILLEGASDIDPFSRTAVAPGLARFGTPEALQALSLLAESDPFTTPGESGPRYLVREAAEKALKMAASQKK